MHRTLLATAFLALPALVLLLGVGSLRRAGIDAVEGALALVLPSLLVTLHARRRSTSP
jgi:F0F1-type ATP synthase assembly protein I